MFTAYSLSLESAFAEEKIAYTKMYGGFWQIWQAKGDKIGAAPLTDSNIDKMSPDWSPDGKKIAYTTAVGELWILEADTKIASKIPLNILAYEPRWSADGKKILFTSYGDVFHDDVDIWRVDIDGTNLKKITKRPWAQASPAWMPGGEDVLFVDSPEILGDEICRINIKNNDIIRITQNKFNDIQPSYIANANKIVCASNRGGDYDIWIMDKFGRDAKNLTANPAYDVMPRPSENGEKIYFISDRGQFSQVFSIDLKTNVVGQVTSDDGDKKDFAVYAK